MVGFSLLCHKMSLSVNGTLGTMLLLNFDLLPPLPQQSHYYTSSLTEQLEERTSLNLNFV